jgi:hypothetical protein
VVAGTLFLRNPASLAPAADRASDRLKTVDRVGFPVPGDMRVQEQG